MKTYGGVDVEILLDIKCESIIACIVRIITTAHINNKALNKALINK
jgi:hypothetical protein